jgi:hypothetical protein
MQKKIKIVLTTFTLCILWFGYQYRYLICTVDKEKMQKLMVSRADNYLKPEFSNLGDNFPKEHPDCCIVRRYKDNPEVLPDDNYNNIKRDHSAFYYIKLRKKYFKDTAINPSDPDEIVDKRYFFLFEAGQCGFPLTAWGGNVEDSGIF